MDPSVFPPSPLGLSLHAPLPRSFPLPFSPVRLNKAALNRRLKCLSFNQLHWMELCSGRAPKVDALNHSHPRFALETLLSFSSALSLSRFMSSIAARRRRGRPERSPAAPASQDAATSSPPQGRRRRTWLRLARAKQCVSRRITPPFPPPQPEVDAGGISGKAPGKGRCRRRGRPRLTRRRRGSPS